MLDVIAQTNCWIVINLFTLGLNINMYFLNDEGPENDISMFDVVNGGR